MQKMAHYQLPVASGILDEKPVGVIAAGNDARQIASGHGGGHSGFIVGRHSGSRVDGNAEPLQQ